MTEKPLAELLEMFVEEARPAILERARALGATHVVVFENPDPWSSRFGDRTALVVGPGCTYGSPEECEGRHLHDLPSRRQYATCYAAVSEEGIECVKA